MANKVSQAGVVNNSPSAIRQLAKAEANILLALMTKGTNKIFQFTDYILPITDYYFIHSFGQSRGYRDFTKGTLNSFWQDQAASAPATISQSLKNFL